MSLKPSEEIPDKPFTLENENSGCGQIRVSLQVMKRSSTTHWISSSAASTREFMKHTSIDPCTRVPKNCKYTELKLYFTVYVYVVYFV